MFSIHKVSLGTVFGVSKAAPNLYHKEPLNTLMLRRFPLPCLWRYTLQEINISHLGKRKHHLQKWFVMGYVIVPWRVYILNHLKVPNLPFTLNFRQWLPPKDPFVCFILSIRDFPHFQSYDRSGRRDAENHQSYEKSGWVWMLRFTLPETNIAHENHHLSWQIPSKWWFSSQLC